MNTTTIKSVSQRLKYKQIKNSYFKYIVFNPRMDSKSVTKNQLLNKAWLVTGQSLRVAVRRYPAYGGQQAIRSAEPNAY